MARAATPDDAEQAIEMIASDGETIRQCSIKLGGHYQSLSSLLCSDVYSVRAKEARMLGAEARIDAAHKALLAIPDGADRACIARQIALEQHERKRASFLHPARFSDKVSAEITGADGGPVQSAVTVTFVTPKASE